jgi:hypothetical protein
LRSNEGKQDREVKKVVTGLDFVEPKGLFLAASALSSISFEASAFDLSDCRHFARFLFIQNFIKNNTQAGLPRLTLTRTLKYRFERPAHFTEN